MSCNEELQGSYRINKSVEFNKVIKAMVAEQQKNIDVVNQLVKEYKSKTRNRSRVDWDLVEKVCPQRWNGTGYYSRLVTCVDLTDWVIRDLIETAIKQRGKLPKVTKHTLDVNDMVINFERQSFEINVWNENHNVERWNSQAAVQGFWKALKSVKWSKRGNKDGGYCTYNCEYQDSPNHQDYYGRIGDDMFAWYTARPF